MQSRDVTWEVCKYLDDSDLKKLYISGVIPDLASVLADDLFWKARIEVHIGKHIPFDSDGESWRSAYPLMLLTNRIWNDEDNPLHVRIAYFAGGKVYLNEIMEAIGKGYEKIVRFYISIGFDYRKYDKPCPLAMAVECGRVGVMQLLIDSHNDDLGERGIQALAAAATFTGCSGSIKPLLQRGAAPGLDIPYWIVRATDDREMIELMLAHPDANPGHNDNMALKYAVEMGKQNALELLLANPRIDPTLNDCEILDIASEAWCSDRVLPILMRDERLRMWSARR